MPNVCERPALWDRSLDRASVEFHISPAARDECTRLIAAVPPGIAIANVTVDARQCPTLTADVNGCRRRLETGLRVLIITPVEHLDGRERRIVAWAIANLLGHPLVQNSDGDRLIAVYARPGNHRVIDGARYHQSREGGGPHTDNVSLPEFWDYLVFSCIRPAAVGGESILIDGLTVHRELKSMPQALRILEGPFWWEYRGISDGLFKAPIVTYDALGQPRFRYLRKYLESAHRRAGEPLTDEQVWALDVLDALVDRSDLQWRTRLAGGEILVTIDSQVFHARTAFADSSAGAPATADDAVDRATWRFFDRVWARRRS
jgi:hypothetical protein